MAIKEGRGGGSGRHILCVRFEAKVFFFDGGQASERREKTSYGVTSFFSPLLLGANGGWKFSAAPPSLTGVANKKTFSVFAIRTKGKGRRGGKNLSSSIFHLLFCLRLFGAIAFAVIASFHPPLTRGLPPSLSSSFFWGSLFSLPFFVPRGWRRRRKENPARRKQKGESLFNKTFPIHIPFSPSLLLASFM